MDKIAKKISNTVLKTSPFFERRMLDDQRKNRRRRYEDSFDESPNVPDVNLGDGAADDLLLYKVSSGKVKAYKENDVDGQVVDYQA